MGNGYVVSPKDEFAHVRSILLKFGERMREVEAPDGSQLFNSVQELRDLVDNLAAKIENVSASGATWLGPVSTTGTVTANTMLNSLGAYNNDITATRRGAWWRSNGDAGYASSSLAKKVLIDSVELPDPIAVLDLCDTYFHYRAELDKRDNPENPEYDPSYHVALEWGSIAEWAHELGLWQIVVYEDHWKPVALHYELMGLLAIRATRYVLEFARAERRERLALDRRVEQLEILAGL